MDASLYETEHTNTLLELQRAQRILDETQGKIRQFRREKLAENSKAQSTAPTSPLPDIREYLSYLINDNQAKDRSAQKLEATAHLRSVHSPSFRHDQEINNYKKTEKDEKSGHFYLSSSSKQNLAPNFDLRKHTLEQLEKSNLLRLGKIEAMGKQKCEVIDKKISELEAKKLKIKNDKVLLIRDNQQLEIKLEQLRKQTNQRNQYQAQNDKIAELNALIKKLEASIRKVEGENSKIVRRKQDLELNMRVCIRNSKEQIQGEIRAKGLKESKSRSVINHRCAYH